MARKYDPEKLAQQLLDAIEKHRLVFFEDGVRFLPCCKRVAYAYELHKIDTVVEALERNRVDMKRGLRTKMYNSESPVAWAMLYKLIGSKEEFERLANSTKRVEHSGPDGTPLQLQHVVVEPKALAEVTTEAIDDAEDVIDEYENGHTEIRLLSERTL